MHTDDLDQNKEALLPQSVAGPRLLDRLISRMTCPKCAADLKPEGESIQCARCGEEYLLHEGIPLMATYGSAETWSETKPPDTSCEYQNQYQDLAAAERYNKAYSNKTEKRWSTRRELRLLERLLGTQPHSEILLNIPCGGGRLSDRIAIATDRLIEADTAIGQLLYARQNSPLGEPRLWMTASAFHIPFKNYSVYGAVCTRLCHHLPTADERERLVAELLRVARRFVIMTFFDYYSPKNYLRRLRRPFNGKPPKMTMTRKRLAELTEQHGATLVDAPTLAYPSSGHRYALIVKNGGSRQ